MRKFTGLFAAAACAFASAAHAQDAQPQVQDPKKDAKKPIVQVKYKGIEDFTGTEQVKSYIVVAGKTREVLLVGWNKEKILCSENSRSVQYKFGEVESAFFIIPEYDEIKTQTFENQKKWKEAYSQILETYQQFVPYAVLNDNNAVGFIFRAGKDIMENARCEAAKSSDGKLPEAAAAEYRKAQKLFEDLSRAQWWPQSRVAQLKAILCLMALGDTGASAEKFDLVPEPEIGDVSYGIYWMVKGKILYELKKTADSLDAEIKSIAYADKDIESFPDALLISAQCYEDSLDYHRARDTYFQVASLFQKTSWGDAAFKRLCFIMDKGLAKKKENVEIEKVFFDSEEDMDILCNKLIRETLSGTKEKGEPRKPGKGQKLSDIKESDKRSDSKENTSSSAEAGAPQADDKAKPAEKKGK